MLGGVEANFLKLAREIGSILEKPAPKRTTPIWVLKLIGRISLWISYITGKEPDITPQKVLLITATMLCNSQKAKRELDFNPVPLKTMLEDCYQWMRSEGLLGQKK